MHISRFARSVFAAVALVAGLVLLLMSSPAWAAFPGQNGQIVFVANVGGGWQLYTINADGSDLVQLTNLAPTSSDSWAPSFSPDGQRIAFNYGPVDANGNAHLDLYVINADGTGLTRLTHDGRSQAPKWSPDGTRLAFARQSKLTGALVVTTMRADGTGAKIALTSDFWDSFADSYTPDGQINFDSTLGGFVSAEWIMNADGSNKKQLTPPPLEGGVSDVSSDGKHIVFTSHNNSPVPAAIFVMNVNGTSLKQLTHPGKASDVFPAFSPDGTKIVFASSRLTAGSLDLFIMNSDGSGITPIATGITVGGCPDGNCVQPSWGPRVGGRCTPAGQQCPPTTPLLPWVGMRTCVDSCLLRARVIGEHLQGELVLGPVEREQAVAGVGSSSLLWSSLRAVSRPTTRPQPARAFTAQSSRTRAPNSRRPARHALVSPPVLLVSYYGVQLWNLYLLSPSCVDPSSRPD